ncbi:hypothetical protein EYZ11_011613 [Aspergillus tanneri]|uniref:Uncharacterized protein n=1 Tax=Aspergillus tanneri TaxID=1220188 RepID=A0A4S3J4J0_9EURO|nr:uncharacterized protein ATNIH1004_007815 [Aspergillus tanneri]KAA8646385.1 hypothetical protein ATNIH1004_007815 [Aspergillus tanneri]THC88938.1 hypothetical protein EYZ11_011613 [Aspergillus tanneri]
MVKITQTSVDRRASVDSLHTNPATSPSALEGDHAEISPTNHWKRQPRGRYLQAAITQGENNNKTDVRPRPRAQGLRPNPFASAILRQRCMATNIGAADSPYASSVVAQDSLVPANASTHTEQGSSATPHGNGSSQPGTDKDLTDSILAEAVEFQKHVDRLVAEVDDERDDTIYDFGLALMRRTPLGEWYRRANKIKRDE